MNLWYIIKEETDEHGKRYRLKRGNQSTSCFPDLFTAAQTAQEWNVDLAQQIQDKLTLCGKAHGTLEKQHRRSTNMLRRHTLNMLRELLLFKPLSENHRQKIRNIIATLCELHGIDN